MKKEVETKKITIDKLAIMMNNGFESLEKKVVTIIHGELTGVKKDISGIKDEITGIKREVEGVKNQLEGTNKRIDDFAENKVSKITHKELENRIDFVEKKLEIKK